MLKKSLIVTAIFPLILSACGGGQPTEAEIREALAEKVNQKGCATSVMFDTMPIKKRLVANNKNTLDALVAAGLLQKSGDTYALTSLGESAYDAKAKGFCYTDHYEIKNIAVVKEEDKSELSGSSLSGAWHVSFTIAPANVSDWAKNSQLLEAASLASLEKVASEKKYTVRFVKVAGEDKISIADPHFSFRPGIHFNMAW